MDNKYILIKDNEGRNNIWEIISESNGVYTISTRESIDFILKDRCFEKEGSSLLYCDYEIDIMESEIEIEDAVQYRSYKRSLEEVTNPFEKILNDNGEYSYSLEQCDTYGIKVK